MKTSSQDPFSTATGLQVTLLNPRHDAPPPSWDAFVTNGRLASNWYWYVVKALALGGRGEYRAALITDGDTVVGLAAFLRRAGGLIQVQAPGTSSLPGITMAGDRDGELGSGPIDIALGTAIVQALESAIRRHHRGKVMVWYRQVYGNLLPVLMDRAAISAPGHPVAWFHNTFDDYDGYLAALSTSRRNDQRRLVRRMDEDPEMTVTWGPGASAPDLNLDRLHTLIACTVDRHRTRWMLPARSLSQEVVEAVIVGPHSMVVRYHRNGTLIGAGLTVDHPTVPVASAWGALDPKDGGRKDLWFDQTSRVMKWVIGSGRQGIVGGKGLVDLKVRVGYRAVPQWSIARRLRS